MRRWIFLALTCGPAAALAADDFKLNAQEYFERPGVNVMYGQDYYPEGHQGGLSVIMHDERIASNGDVRLEPSPGQWSPIPKPGKREIDASRQEIRVALAYPDAHSGYHRAESREKHAELRSQQSSLSHSGPRRLAVTWPSRGNGGGGRAT